MAPFAPLMASLAMHRGTELQSQLCRPVRCHAGLYRQRGVGGTASALTDLRWIADRARAQVLLETAPLPSAVN